MKRVRLDEIAFDAGTQIRAAIDERVVQHYADLMSEGVTFPAIVLFHDGNHYYLADGFHRGLAAKRIGFKDFNADVRFGTKTEALWFALGANKTNGHQMTPADKKHAILLALKTWPERSQREIAEQVGCSKTWVQNMKAEIVQVVTTDHLPERVIGKDGKSYPASRPTTPARHPKHDAVVARLVSGESLGSIAKAERLGNQTVAKIRDAAGISRGPDKSQASVQARRERMREMAANGYTSLQIAADVGLAVASCRSALKYAGIDVPADRVTGGLRQHDSTRIVEHMVMDAENLTADVGLIDFGDIDPQRIPGWLASLQASRDKLSGFIRRLMKEQQKHGEAA